ncbi:MAG: hypothetical protein AB7O24_25400 [Kofleriaceae bacterium]
MNPAVHEKFEALLRAEGLNDPSWVLQLDDIDEPPLFTRHAQVEFLRDMPEEERCVAAVECVLSLLEKHAKEAIAMGQHRRFFLCATFLGFDEWRSGEVPIPTPAILVDPNDGITPRSDIGFVQPYTPEGKNVANWLTRLGTPFTERFVVAELPSGSFDPEIHRVYVGWRDNPSANVRSVGSEMSLG